MRLRLVLLAVGLAANAACSSRSSEGCNNPVREPLDPNSGVHLIDPNQARYSTDPPTSGPHLFKPPPRGRVERTLLPAEQVSILETGDVLVQYRDSALASELNALAGGRVTVAPNPSLPAPVVVTAWTYKLTCSTPDLAEIRSFIAAQRQNPGGH